LFYKISEQFFRRLFVGDEGRLDSREEGIAFGVWWRGGGDWQGFLMSEVPLYKTSITTH